jgi:enterochelin esterase-like enzyme
MSRVRFEIVPPIEHPEEPVLVCGNARALGEWDAARALALHWDGDRHVGVIEADTGTTLEFKLLRGSWEAEAVDAWGSVPGNARHDVWLDATVHRTVADWKDRYAGRLTRDRVYSRGLAAWRELLIWLPPSYATEPARRYPVLYFNDGANVFDPETSPITGVDLAVDEWVRRLAAERSLPESIVVGVCHPEGFGEGMRSERDIDLSLELGGVAYADFLATELVPAIDARYRTRAEPAARLIGGASLGALNACYVASQFPAVFGRMLGLSLVLDGAELPARAARAAGSRFYFDYGTEGIDAGLEPIHRELARQFREQGGAEGRDFRILRVIGGRHDEASWRTRLGEGLRFLAS